MRRRTKFLALLAVTGLFLAFALGSGSGGSNSQPQVVGTVSTEDNEISESEILENEVSIEESTDKAETEKEENTVDESKKEFYVGDVLSANGLEITYVKSGYYTSDNDFTQPAEGKKVISLDFYCENTGSSDQNISSFDFSCFADGYDCQAYYGADSISATLSSGRTVSGSIFFEVPEDATAIEVEYEVNWISSERVKFIFEGEKDSGFVPENRAEASTNTFQIGEILETDTLKITYLSAGIYESDNRFLKPAEGKKYIYAELEFENIGKSDEFVSSFSFDCFADGVSCDAFYGMEESLDATISAGRKTKGKIAFEVPEDAKIIEIEYLDNYWSSERIIFSYSED